jgi:deoxyribonuclease-4
MEKSQTALVADLELCPRIGAKGSIVHAGSHKGAGFDAVLERVAAAVRRILKATPKESWLILENSAGMGGSVGAHFEELGTIIREVGDPRVKVCLDTQHAFAMGYDLITEKGLAATLAEFKKEIGLGKSSRPQRFEGSVYGVRDRHEHRQGQIGLEAGGSWRIRRSRKCHSSSRFGLRTRPDKGKLDI